MYMTKTDLLRMLEPLDDDIVIWVVDDNTMYPAKYKYIVDNHGDGRVLLTKGAVAR